MPYDYIAPLSVGNALPLSPAEIDALPNADRIWATINEALGNLEEDTEEDLFKANEEATEFEEQVQRLESLNDDLVFAVRDASFAVTYDSEGWPKAICHNIVPATPHESDLLDALSDRLWDLKETILDNHFRDEDEVLKRQEEEGLRV